MSFPLHLYTSVSDIHMRECRCIESCNQAPNSDRISAARGEYIKLSLDPDH